MPLANSLTNAVLPSGWNRDWDADHGDKSGGMEQGDARECAFVSLRCSPISLCVLCLIFHISRTFLAVKYGSEGMKVTSDNKLLSGGSIVMTASGGVLFPPLRADTAVLSDTLPFTSGGNAIRRWSR